MYYTYHQCTYLHKNACVISDCLPSCGNSYQATEAIKAAMYENSNLLLCCRLGQRSGKLMQY